MGLGAQDVLCSCAQILHALDVSAQSRVARLQVASPERRDISNTPVRASPRSTKATRRVVSGCARHSRPFPTNDYHPTSPHSRSILVVSVPTCSSRHAPRLTCSLARKWRDYDGRLHPRKGMNKSYCPAPSKRRQDDVTALRRRRRPRSRLTRRIIQRRNGSGHPLARWRLRVRSQRQKRQARHRKGSGFPHEMRRPRRLRPLLSESLLRRVTLRYTIRISLWTSAGLFAKASVI